MAQRDWQAAAALAVKSPTQPKTTAQRVERLPRIAPRSLVARYDAAQTTTENSNHWAMADSLSAAAAASPEVRSKLRNRARYEIANNSYASGMVRTLANDTIGTGPKLALASGDSKADRQVVDLFWDWSESIGLAAKLRLMRTAKCGDGETLAVMVDNRGSRRQTKLDVRLYESEQLTAPIISVFNGNLSDGIVFDDYGNPAQYKFLRYHPGGDVYIFSDADFDEVRADKVIHWFRRERPGQLRGIPEITPALPLYAQLRRYTLAVLGAAETAADVAGIMHSEATEEDPDDLVPLDPIEIQKRMIMSLPRGWQISQLKAEQPTTTYEMFKRAIISEIARCLNMPYNVAAGDSSSYNYSSGRLDHRTYYKSIRVERSECENVVLDPLFRRWWGEARIAERDFPDTLRDWESPPLHEWHWDGDEHVDPAKEANAQETRLQSMTTTLAREYARDGLDWEEQLAQVAREREKMQELGLIRESDPTDSDPRETDDEEE